MILAVVLTACEQFIAALPPAARPSPATDPSAPAATLRLNPVAYPSLPGWRAERHSAILPVFLKSCEKLRSLPSDQPMGSRHVMGRISDWLAVCAEAAGLEPGNDALAQYFLESHFVAYAVTNDAVPVGLFTGYYEPELRGSWQPDALYRFPILGRPDDLVSADLGAFDPKWRGHSIAGRLDGNAFVPYPTRKEIERGALKGRHLELLWVDDPVDAFFLHIQGSGRVRMPDGSYVRVGYAGRNGHRYTPIGRELVAAGAMRLEDVSMPTLRDWLEANPAAGQSLMKRNKSFVFFRVVDGAGPIGAQDVALTPGRSLAVDTAHIPLGAPLWLVTTEPGDQAKQPLRRLVVAQDTGSAIRGPVRGDLFWGFGEAAGDKAGRMRERGIYFLLLPRSAARS